MGSFLLVSLAKVLKSSESFRRTVSCFRVRSVITVGEENQTVCVLHPIRYILSSAPQPITA